MKDKRKPPRGEPRQVRLLTKSEAHKRAQNALSQRNQAIEERRAVVARMMELEVILGALVAREGRVRIDMDALTASYTDLEMRVDTAEDGRQFVVLECSLAKDAPAEPGEGLAAIAKHGFTVVENPQPKEAG